MNKKIKVSVFLLLILPSFVFAHNQEGPESQAGITPGSKFYFLDKFSERVRELFAFSPKAKVRLQISFATERTAEINKLLEDIRAFSYSNIRRDKQEVLLL